MVDHDDSLLLFLVEPRVDLEEIGRVFGVSVHKHGFGLNLLELRCENDLSVNFVGVYLVVLNDDSCFSVNCETFSNV